MLSGIKCRVTLRNFCHREEKAKWTGHTRRCCCAAVAGKQRLALVCVPERHETGNVHETGEEKKDVSEASLSNKTDAEIR